jgi:hypothetical protein
MCWYVRGLVLKLMLKRPGQYYHARIAIMPHHLVFPTSHDENDLLAPPT